MNGLSPFFNDNRNVAHRDAGGGSRPERLLQHGTAACQRYADTRDEACLELLQSSDRRYCRLAHHVVLRPARHQHIAAPAIVKLLTEHAAKEAGSTGDDDPVTGEISGHRGEKGRGTRDEMWRGQEPKTKNQCDPRRIPRDAGLDPPRTRSGVPLPRSAGGGLGWGLYI